MKSQLNFSETRIADRLLNLENGESDTKMAIKVVKDNG